MSTVVLLLCAGATLLSGAVVSLAMARRRHGAGWVAVAAMGAAAVLLWTAVLRTFSLGPDPAVTLVGVPGLGAGLTLAVDRLSAVFLAIAGTIGVLTTLFAVEYLDRYPLDSVAKYYPLLLLLFVGIVGVASTQDLLFFLVFWELMTLTSYFLVVFERESPVAHKAGLQYFVMNQAATLAMIAAALVLWREGGSFHFEELRTAFERLLAREPLLGHGVLLLFFLGFATKAGILPMGAWLPHAYPAAPTSATAVFAGAMSKLGVYGLVRVFLTLVPVSPAMESWGWVIAIGGTASLFVGTLTALRQDDAKRLMSFHVVGQVGYMFLGVGVGMVLLPSNPWMGSLAVTAGLFHLLNNALYKTALFLGAGGLHTRTGTRSLNGMGGLGRLMPWTAGAALLGSLAIAGVPPLNGFASKWLLYATGILGGRGSPFLVVLVLVAMFISLVTLASFLKYYGSAFLGPPMESRPADAVASGSPGGREGDGGSGGRPPGSGVGEVGLGMLLPQGILAAACVFVGLFPWFPLEAIQRGVWEVLAQTNPYALGPGVPPESLGPQPMLGLALGESGLALWAPLPAAFALLLLGLLVYAGLQRAPGTRIREVPIWVCGEEEEPSALRYGSKSFYSPFKHAFHWVYPTLRIQPPPFPSSLRRALNPDRWLYLPLVGWVVRASRAAARSHVGVPQVYLLWIVLGAAAVVAVILLSLG